MASSVFALQLLWYVGTRDIKVPRCHISRLAARAAGIFLGADDHISAKSDPLSILRALLHFVAKKFMSFNSKQLL